MYQDALEIVTELKRAGFIAYFAGGWVRDYVMGHPSPDIDIATSASPDEVVSLFKHTVPIGKAFGVVLVVMHGVGYEVASFRKDDLYIDGRRPESVTFSTPEEDAERRDFTINGLFFDPLESQVIDFVGGLEDIQKKHINAIGDPYQRFREDRLRMIRAVRFSARFGFTIGAKTREAILKLAPELYPAVSKERVLNELKKMGGQSSFPQGILELKKLGLWDIIFPIGKRTSAEAMEAISLQLQAVSQPLPFLFTLSCYFKGCADADVIQSFDDLKLSSQEKLDLLFALFCHRLSKKSPKEVTLEEWVDLFAHPQAKYALDWLEVSSGFTKAFLSEKEKKLAPHSERKRKGITLVRSKELLDLGIEPGKLMGQLLKEGESIALHHNLNTAQEVIQELQKTPLWPHEKR